MRVTYGSVNSDICLGLCNRCPDDFTGHRCFHHNNTSSHISVQCRYFLHIVHDCEHVACTLCGFSSMATCFVFEC